MRTETSSMRPSDGTATRQLPVPLTMTLDEISDLLQVSGRSVWRYVAAGRLPTPFKGGRKALWDRQSVMEAYERWAR